MLQDNELQIPPQIETEIREARHRIHIGEIDDLSRHSMLTMLKVAAGFMWLDGRTDKITDEDCELARIVMAISDHTRKRLGERWKHDKTGGCRERQIRCAAGTRQGWVCWKIERRADIDRVIARVMPRLAAADEKTMSGAELRKTMRDVNRDLFDEDDGRPGG